MSLEISVSGFQARLLLFIDTQGLHIWHCSASSMPGGFPTLCLGRRKFGLSGGDLLGAEWYRTLNTVIAKIIYSGSEVIRVVL